MRIHKGNTPSLPQTKHCPLCPAKFTRTTHLNRHLRSHTNERLHRCDACLSQFTRSDLLTRHKRTCGDPSRTNRSRRKSCEACAESKIKCDLQDPCSKCSSRGRQCIFINDPSISRKRRSVASKRSRIKAPDSDSVSEGCATSDSSSSYDDNVNAFPSQADPSSDGQSSRESTVDTDLCSEVSSSLAIVDAPPNGSEDRALGPAATYNLDSPLTVSCASSPRSESNTFDDGQNPGLDVFVFDDLWNIDFCFEGQREKAFINANIADGKTLPLATDESSWNDNSFSDLVVVNNANVALDAGWEQLFLSFDTLEKIDPLATIPETCLPSLPGSGERELIGSPENTHCLPSVEDQYLSLFSSVFLTQFPILHLSTLHFNSVPPLLLRAMQACGAVFVKTRSASSFIAETLKFGRDVLVQAAETNPSDLKEQVDIVLAMVLLQTIGLFCDYSFRDQSAIYHAALIKIIRQFRLIERLSSWVVPELTDSSLIDVAWRKWAQYESMKRILLLAYIQDCCQASYFGLTWSLNSSESRLALPCDTPLWTAQNPTAWVVAVSEASLSGSVQSHLVGFQLQQVLSSLRQPSPPRPLNLFALFIVIHSVLRDVCVYHNQSHSPSVAPDPHYNQELGIAFETLAALQAWLQCWTISPETKNSQASIEQVFVYDALPFYWLAQAVLFLPHEDKAMPIASRFHIMIEWTQHIRRFLTNRQRSPRRLWHDLIGIKSQMTGKGDCNGDLLSSRGLLSYAF